MKLFEVVNGFMGFSYVHVLVIATSPERAIELARESYKRGARTSGLYNETYWRNLRATELMDATVEGATEPRD